MTDNKNAIAALERIMICMAAHGASYGMLKNDRKAIEAALHKKEDPQPFGTALQALQFASTLDDHYDVKDFVSAWFAGDIEEFPEYIEFLKNDKLAEEDKTFALQKQMDDLKKADDAGFITTAPYIAKNYVTGELKLFDDCIKMHEFVIDHADWEEDKKRNKVLEFLERKFYYGLGL